MPDHHTNMFRQTSSSCSPMLAIATSGNHLELACGTNGPTTPGSDITLSRRYLAPSIMKKRGPSSPASKIPGIFSPASRGKSQKISGSLRALKKV